MKKEKIFDFYHLFKKIVNIEEILVTWIRFNFLGIQDLDPDPDPNPHLNEMNQKRPAMQRSDILKPFSSQMSGIRF